MDIDLRKLVVVEPGTTQLGMVEIETERPDQVQACAAVRAEANHVAGVRRNLGLIEDDVQHAAIINPPPVHPEAARRAGERLRRVTRRAMPLPR